VEDTIAIAAHRSDAAADRLAEARAHLAAGRLDRAEAAAQKALRRAPEAEALHLLGLIARDRGRLPRAVQLLEKAARAAPDSAAVLCDLGLAYKAAGRIDEAIGCQRRVAERLPDSPMALANLGSALVAAGRAAEAVQSLKRAAALAPAQPEIAYNLGNALAAAGEAQEAAVAFRRVLELDPAHVRARMNLGIVLRELGRVVEATGLLRAAHAVMPNNAEAEWNLALALLMSGAWTEGWHAYEARRRMAGFAIRRVAAAPWDGTALDGRTLLVHAEQGLGDTIQSIRWLSRLAGLNGTVLFQAPQSLRRLLAGLDAPVQLVGDDAPAADLEVPLMSLPHLVGPAEPFWPGRPYLTPDPERVARWRHELGGRGGLTVAIAWQGNPNFRGDRTRSVPLAAMAPLAAVPGVRLVSLQRLVGQEQIATVPWGGRITDLGPAIDVDGAFADTAAITTLVDVLVTSDTGTAHVAGAVGARVWVALRDVPDWRWGAAGGTTPWYPSMRLFRQLSPGDWASVFDRIAEKLAKWGV
jgi:Flp pilus assembly protein TadD